jgi:hypothetical protein
VAPESDPAHVERIFDDLPFFGQNMPPDALAAALRDIGKPGGILDARDELGAGPANLITDPTLSAHNPNNPNHTAECVGRYVHPSSKRSPRRLSTLTIGQGYIGTYHWRARVRADVRIGQHRRPARGDPFTTSPCYGTPTLA